MTWREDLRRVTIGGKQLVGASFRGVAFLVESAERGGGRRTVLHEFPLRDDPFVEDLGRKARPFRIDGYVIGDDYLSQRDALLAALEDTAGPGELVHPYHGVIRAICTTLSVRESRADGGMATFAIEFAETPAQSPAPTEVVDSVEQVSTSADAAHAATEAELVEKFDAAGLPAFARASAESVIAVAAEVLEAGLAPLISATQELAELTGRVALLTARAASLVTQPAEALDAFRSTIAGLAETIAGAPGAVARALIGAYFADVGRPVVGTTATRERERANQLALIGALRRAFAIEAARLLPRVPFATIDEATAARDQVAAMLEEQAAAAGDTAYPALVDLRSEVLRAVPGSSAFARVVTVTRAAAIPSLLLAYQLYGSVDLEPDILARNGIRNPGFVAGELKVLSDG
ncbi:MAG: DNA circularization protein [Kofleriaceae bacterium]